MPQASFGGDYVHTTVFEMATAYTFHIAQNQPFADGNKRAGLAYALGSLDINSIELNDPEEKLFDAMITIAEPFVRSTTFRATAEMILVWIRSRIDRADESNFLEETLWGF